MGQGFPTLPCVASELSQRSGLYGEEAQMDLRGSLRLFRAVLITGMATSPAGAGHILGGEVLPGPGTTAVLTALLPGHR